MPNIKILAPIESNCDLSQIADTSCKDVYIDFKKIDLTTFDEILRDINEHRINLYINFDSHIKDNEVPLASSIIEHFKENSVIAGIMINSFAILDLIKAKKLPFDVIIDSDLNIHNLSGIDFVNMFYPVDFINLSEEVYIKNLKIIKKYTKKKILIDSDNLPWFAEELKKSRLITAIVVKGDFEDTKKLIDGIHLIENILEKPKLYKKQKLPFKRLKNYTYESNHFAGEFHSSDGSDFSFSGNIKPFNWEYKIARLDKKAVSKTNELPKLSLRFVSLEQLKSLKAFIKKLGYNPIYSIEYGEILSTTDLYKNSFNMILDKVKEFCYEHKIKLHISTPRILIERDYDRVYDYVKLLYLQEPYPQSIVVNNIGYWWSIINDPDFSRVKIELGQGLNLTNSQSMKSLALLHSTNAIDLSNMQDFEEIRRCISSIKSFVPNRKLTIAGCIRVPSLGLCPLNNDSAILSRLSCSAPCHKGTFAIHDPSLDRDLPVSVDGFCRMHLFKDKILDLFGFIENFENIGVNEFVVDFSGLNHKLVPVLLTRFLNATVDNNYTPCQYSTSDMYDLL